MKTVQSADGTIIAFDQVGAGPALILVVGAFSDRSSTQSLAARLASTFTVYAYDRRGRGDSTEAGPYALEREVEDLAAVVRVAGGSAVAFGHSSGAALVLEAAAHGVPLRRLAVYEPPYTEGPTNAIAARLTTLAAEGRSAEAVEAFMRLQGMPPQVLDQMKSGPYWAHLVSFAPTVAHEVGLCNEGVVPVERLARIAAPTLALAGGASPAWARDVARAIAAAVPHGRSEVLEGQGHGAADEVLAPVLAAFFG